MPRSVLAIAGIAVAGLLLVANEYGFHRDELYFVIAGQHPAWGYEDQPPLTPLLSAAGVALLGISPIAVRILPALVVGASVLLAASMAREMGGGRRAQEVAALAVALSGFLLGGHLASTGTYDALFWVLITWLLARLLGGGDPRLWLVIGVAFGLGLLNKWTVALLGASLVAALLVDLRWSILRSPWPWVGAAIAAAMWAPNLLWQASRDFPQLDMARLIAARTGGENQNELALLQLLLAGPLMWPIIVLGVGRLVLARGARPWRPFAWAYVIALALTYWQGGKAYYTMGLFPVLFAAGAVPVGAWLDRGRRAVRLGAFGAAAALSGAAIVVLALPVLPPAVLVSSGVHDLNKEHGEQIGWPDLVAEVRAAVGRLTAEERARTAILTANYGEAGAIALLGPDLPPVYSGHNSYWDFGRPPEDTRVVVLVGSVPGAAVGDCVVAGSAGNRYGVNNEERGAPIQVCRGMPASWAESWSRYHHLD